MVNVPFLNQTKTTQLPNVKPGESFFCYEIPILSGNETGEWQEVDPVSNALPAFIMQLIIITSLSRIIHLLLRPLHQPRIVAEIIVSTKKQKFNLSVLNLIFYDNNFVRTLH